MRFAYMEYALCIYGIYGTSSHPGNVTLTAPTINHIISVYNEMKKNNSTGGFTKIATVAMQALHPVSGFDAGGRNVTALPNGLDFGDMTT